MANNLAPYPTDLGEAAGVLLRHFRGDSPPLSETAHAAYQILGVGLGNLLPDPALFGGSACPCPDCPGPDGCSDEECCRVLERAAAPQAGGVKGFLDSALMKQLVAIAIKFLLDNVLKQSA